MDGYGTCQATFDGLHSPVKSPCRHLPIVGLLSLPHHPHWKSARHSVHVPWREQSWHCGDFPILSTHCVHCVESRTETSLTRTHGSAGTRRTGKHGPLRNLKIMLSCPEFSEARNCGFSPFRTRISSCTPRRESTFPSAHTTRTRCVHSSRRSSWIA